MQAVLNILQKTLVLTFYRRNAIFFGLVLFFFVAVVRPPTFFFSEAFVGFLLVDPISMAGVLGLFVVYFLYTLRYLHQVPGEPAHQFLHVLPALGRKRLRLPTLLTVIGVLAPVLLYLGTMVFHGIVLGKWPGGIAGVLAIVMLVIGQQLLLRRLMRPLAARGNRFRLQLKLPRNAMPLIYLGMLRRRHRNAVFITKLASFFLLFLMLFWESIEPLPYALRGMAFLASALLQGYLVMRLRATEKLELGWFRNLPFSSPKRMGHFLVTKLLLDLPEFFLLLLFILREGLSPWLLPHFALATSATWLLCVGITYLPQVRSQDFYVLLHSFAVGIFIGLLFQLPVYLMYGPALLLGAFMVVWGVYRED